MDNTLPSGTRNGTRFHPESKEETKDKDEEIQTVEDEDDDPQQPIAAANTNNNKNMTNKGSLQANYQSSP